MLESLLPLVANSMRKPTIVLILLFAVCLSGFGQNTPAKAVYPRIVKTFQLFNQTAPLSPITIYTPKDWGTFRISASIIRTVKGKNTSAAWFEYFNWQDGGGMESSDGNGFIIIAVACGDLAPGYGEGVFTVRMKSGTPLKIAVRDNGDPAGSKYNVFVVVERLM